MSDTTPTPLQAGGPAFLVDDATLAAVEHALGAAYTFNDEGEQVLVGADYSLSQLLDFMSGYDPVAVVPLDEWGEVVEYVGGVVYTPHDVIAALIAEVRRLRAVDRAREEVARTLRELLAELRQTYEWVTTGYPPVLADLLARIDAVL